MHPDGRKKPYAVNSQPMLAPLVLLTGCWLGYYHGQPSYIDGLNPPYVLISRAWLDFARALATYMATGFLLTWQQRTLKWPTWLGIAMVVVILVYEMQVKVVILAFAGDGYELWSQVFASSFGLKRGLFEAEGGRFYGVWTFFYPMLSLIGIELGLLLCAWVRKRGERCFPAENDSVASVKV